VSSLTYFIFGYGISKHADGGLTGEKNFFGNEFKYHDPSSWLYYYSLLVTTT